eukprot:m.163880 g.163880  ORF g.163880 m.163880 type:complete len:297 (+) comp17700_c0_seq1:230-1120(+)
MAASVFPSGPVAVIFDLDGTLVETEMLKARSYAHTARMLCQCDSPDALGLLDPKQRHCHKLARKLSSKTATETSDKATVSIGQRCADKAMTVFKNNIGATSETVSRAMVTEMGLEPKLQAALERFQVSEPWEALYKLRKETYYDTFATPENIGAAGYAHNLDTLRTAAAQGLPVAVATSSSTADAERVVQALGVRDHLRVVNGRDTVEHPKPAPEIYVKTAADLGIKGEGLARCLVFEDSVTGVTAACAAGCAVIAVANPFTEESLRAQTVLDQRWVVYDVKTQLTDTIAARCAEM